MGCIYYHKDKRNKRWRVQIRHRGFPHVSRSFNTEKQAKAFLVKANSIILKKMAKKGTSNALNKLKGEKFNEKI